MTREQYIEYLSLLDEHLLEIIYNGYRIVEDLEPVENVTLEIALADDDFIRWDMAALEDEYRKGL